MKFCALIYRGQLVEVSMVTDDHDFGDHGNHFHVQAKLVESHMCVDKPLIAITGEDLEEENPNGS